MSIISRDETNNAIRQSVGSVLDHFSNAVNKTAKQHPAPLEPQQTAIAIGIISLFSLLAIFYYNRKKR